MNRSPEMTSLPACLMLPVSRTQVIRESMSEWGWHCASKLRGKEGGGAYTKCRGGGWRIVHVEQHCEYGRVCTYRRESGSIRG